MSVTSLQHAEKWVPYGDQRPENSWVLRHAFWVAAMPLWAYPCKYGLSHAPGVTADRSPPARTTKGDTRSDVAPIFRFH